MVHRILAGFIALGVAWFAALVLTGICFSFQRKSDVRLVVEWGLIIVVPLGVWIGVYRGVISMLKANEKEKAKGLCRVCGYDLRATPYRCPECGAEVDGRGSGGNMGW